MRHLFGFLCVCALGLMPVVGCSETAGDGGSGGSAGSGGTGGSAGSGGGDASPCDDQLCEDVDCDDANPCTRDVCDVADGTCSHLAACDDFNDCTTEICDPADGSCSTATAVADGTSCAGGTCESGACVLSGSVLPCTEQGIRNAIAAGDATYTFACDGTAPVVTEAEIEIDNSVILDGEGKLTVDGNCAHGVFSVPGGVTAELRGFTVTRGGFFTEGGLGDPGAFTPPIENQGTLTLTDSSVSENVSGIFSEGTLTLTNSTVSNNGDGIGSEGTLTLTNSTVSENAGRGIFNGGTATVTNSLVSKNDANEGGGILNEGTLTLTNSTVSENTAVDGGGIFNNAGTVTLTNSTVSGNDGGGIWNTWNDVWIGGTVTLTNSTVSQDDWGILIWNGGTVTLTNSTVSGGIRANTNVDPGDPPALISVVTTATVIDGGCTVEGPDVEWTTSNGYNIESPGNTCGFDQTGDQSGITEVQLNLGELADNDGPTMTHKPGDGGFDDGSSVAIDAIPGDACDLTEDQRGKPRPETDGTMCDVGSVEVQPEL